MTNDALKRRALKYAELSGNVLDLATHLGHGTDGCVWKTAKKTAVKALELEKNYNTELECYQRFKKSRVTAMQGFAIPELIGHNDSLLVIEMRIVAPPFLLDFAKAYLDQRPDFSETTLAEWEDDCKERFGVGRWRTVRSLIWGLERYGIYYYDAKPGNIAFTNDEPDET